MQIAKKNEIVPLTDNVVGFVTLFDSTGNKTGNNSGVTVTVENTNNSATTDNTGKYVLNNVHIGEFCLVYTKTGYGTWKRYSSLNAAGGSSPYYLSMVSLYPACGAKISSFAIKDSSDINGNNYKIITGALNPAANNLNPIRILFAFGKNASFTYGNASYAYVTTAYSGTFSYVLYNYELQEIQANCGNIVYLKAYAFYTYFTENEYYDPETGIEVNPSLGPASNVLSFTIN